MCRCERASLAEQEQPLPRVPFQSIPIHSFLFVVLFAFSFRSSCEDMCECAKTLGLEMIGVVVVVVMKWYL